MGLDDFDLFDFALRNTSDAEKETAVEEAETPQFGDTPDTEENSPSAEERKTALGKAELRQAAMAFLATMKPDGIAANVPTRRSKYKVAAAGFWRSAHSRKGTRIAKTALVVMYDDLNCCFSDCAGREQRIATINMLQQRKTFLETWIRENEPHLAAADDLFGEFRSWDYASTKNPEYRKICRELEKELKKLTQGSKLDCIRRAGNADLCYLAIPENLTDPTMIPAEWGVVTLTSSPRGFKLVREPESISDVSDDGRMLLALNIACAAAPAACFASGVDANGRMRRPPRRRKA